MEHNNAFKEEGQVDHILMNNSHLYRWANNRLKFWKFELFHTAVEDS